MKNLIGNVVSAIGTALSRWKSRVGKWSTVALGVSIVTLFVLSFADATCGGGPDTAPPVEGGASRKLGASFAPSGTGCMYVINGVPQLSAFPCSDGGGGSSSSGINCLGGDLDGGCADGGPIYVVGWADIPLVTGYRTPGASNVPYSTGTTWNLSTPTITGDVTGTASSNVTAATVVSATGSGTNGYDAGGAKFLVTATQECLANGTNGEFCAVEAPTVFNDATTWQTIMQRQTVVNAPMHLYVLFTADDFSADGGSITKNFVKANLEVHAMTDTAETLIVPQAGSDVGPGPISLTPIANSDMTGCTTNNTDAGCAPGQTTTWLFRATTTGTFPPVLQIQAQAVGTTRWPWKGHAKVDEQRSSP